MDNHNRVLKIVENGEITHRQCKTCKEMKEISAFPKMSHGLLSRRAHCRTCYNDKVRDYNRKMYSPEKRKAQSLLKNYGLTIYQVSKALADQHGLCANRGCGKEISLTAESRAENRAVVDHDHATGQFRALLCHSCNIHLGRIEKDRNQTLGLLEYLSKHTQKETLKK